ncbi:MAG TPA: ATP-binding protein [Candidatus Eisenbergiella merdavium]|uniref:ATP-binding protein n=1 Tax=Candidatus Eisenbergiella merdavium TaxID=2838551 RepID=A0A9D2SN51_9FIRM|nr:ATP-binding protein [Candidatus Eisenbergiella merdavium]
MFTYIRLKNFMSFRDVTFDFRNGRKGSKKFIAIYGENGSGKSNFVHSIEFLRRSIDSLMTPKEVFPTDTTDSFQQTFSRGTHARLVRYLIEFSSVAIWTGGYRMAECEEETSAEYGFCFNGHEGCYEIRFNKKVIYEKLYYFTGKQSGTLFELSCQDGRIQKNFSNKLFTNQKVKSEISDEIDKYWGKHTFLSILNKERSEKNEQYIKDSYLPFLFDILTMIQEMTIHCNKASFSGSEFDAGIPSNILKELGEGEIEKKYEPLLNCSERILNDFLTQIYSDIKEIYYEKTYREASVSYTLYVKKMIGGKIRKINFRQESAGTQQILEIIHSLLGAFCGVTVVYDEIDNGIHDLLLKTILESMTDYITGQLIVTTHNTYMLEAIEPKSAYIINVDYQGNKSVRSLDQFTRIQGSNNPRSMYLKGLFGGIPVIDTVDYDSILQELSVNVPDTKGGV